MPIVDYTVPIGHRYGEILPFAESRDDFQVGVWIWHYDTNHRYYAPRSYATCIIEGYYRPTFIFNESKTHWHLSHSSDYTPSLPFVKIKKQELKESFTFFSHDEMLDYVWMAYNRYEIEKAVALCDNDEMLAKVLESIDGCDVFDYDKYLKKDAPQLPLGEAISKAFFDDTRYGAWGSMPRRAKVSIYRNIADAIEYQDVKRVDLELWQTDRKKRI